MTKEQKKELEKRLYDAFLFAINAIGIDNFKKCSFFLSNQRRKPNGS